ncbi:IS3 family transposase [Microbacterium paludicola]|uniref:IS3 family transposase n=1 Tax=Microbacterium paludicola TaxID=300019 RepID=UPI001430E07F|nr:IS3 family transposase [Microbacterium paludicola]MBF0817768.1 IS3 family transposase [Microbacterium paludicola]
MLTEHGVKIAPSTYYDARGRGPSSREVSDERWKPIILTTWQQQRRVLGARKLWLRLRRDGHDIARCTVERLMRELGIAGVIRGNASVPSIRRCGRAGRLTSSTGTSRGSARTSSGSPTSHTCGRGPDGSTSRSCSMRTPGSIDDLTPLEVEQLDYARIEPVEQAG